MASRTASTEHNNNNTHDNAPIKEISNIPSLVCAFMASLTTGGTTYAFGLYADALKKSLHLSQSQLDTISTAFFFAGLFSWVPGLATDKFGARWTLMLGGLTGGSALMTYWLVAIQHFLVPRALLVPTLSILGITIFLSCASVTGSVFKIIVSSTGAGTKGAAVGVAKAYVGLGSGLYASLYSAIRQPNESDLDFLPMTALFAVLCATLPALFLLPAPVPTTATATNNNSYTPEEPRRSGGNTNNSGTNTNINNNNSPNPYRTTRIIRDDATPGHFRVLYLSLLVMATGIVGQSLMALFAKNTDGADTAFSAADVFDAPHRLLLSENGTIPSNSNSNNNSSNNDNSNNNMMMMGSKEEWQRSSSEHTPGGPHYPVAIFLLLVWLGPILGLLCLPKKNHAVEGAMMALATEEEDDDDHEIDEEELEGGNNDDDNNNLVEDDGFEEDAFTPSEPITSNLAVEAARHRKVPTTALVSSTKEEEALRLLSTDEATTAATAGPIPAPAQIIEEEIGLNLLGMLKTPSALLMLWTTTILVGGGTVVTNNMGQMVEALGFPSSVTTASLALFSVAQSAARVGTGALSEAALTSDTRSFWIIKGVPRPFFLVLASLVGFIAHLILGLAQNEGVFVFGSMLAGAAFGMVWPLLVLIVGELFGTANVAANYMFYDGFTSAAGTLFLSKILAQDVYEDHIDPNASDQFTCYGTACFKLTHFGISGLSLSCLATSVAMLYTSRDIYNRAAIRRLRRSR